MSTNIREYIIQNFKESDSKEIEDSIVEAVNSHDEIMLPGVGVFFCILWENSDDEMKQNILEILKKSII